MLVKEYQEFQRGDSIHKSLDVGDDRSELWPKSYENLPEKLKEKARESTYDYFMETGYIDPRFIIDDDYLLEPDHDELIKMFGSNFYEKLNGDDGGSPLIGNDHANLEFDIDQNKIWLHKAAEVNDDDYFLLWLGVPDNLLTKVEWEFIRDSMNINAAWDHDLEDAYVLTTNEEEMLRDAEEKWEGHAKVILQRIKDGYEYYETQEGIEDEIEANGEDWRYNREGMKVNESLNEFERGKSIHKALGVGLVKKIEDWMEENTSMNRNEYDVNNDGRINMDMHQIRNRNFWDDDLPDYIKINLNQHVHHNGFNSLRYDTFDKHIERNKFEKGSEEKFKIDLIDLRQIYISNEISDFNDKLSEIVEDYGQVFEKDHEWNYHIDSILYSTGIEKKIKQQITMSLHRINRDELEIETDKYFNMYIFISYDDYKEVTIDGEDYHKKFTGIENLLKIDKYNINDLSNVSGMKMRAHTVENGKVYAVRIPKYMADENNYYNDSIDDKLRKYIDENKYKV